MRGLADTLIAAFNAGDPEAVAALFTPQAVIDDPSTGERFDGYRGIRDYILRFFVGYHTVTRLLSIAPLAEGRAGLRVDFTGDFGHEIGRLDLTVDADGRITRIDADLEQAPACRLRDGEGGPATPGQARAGTGIGKG
ncbi:nuclear transport factor 2 family protein [Paroceanicella profunda]|uniref:Nuclear transport factor 2 family protein n=2 Tax=Paroceanicella profunda TaxID=2579971 RepID=A0A5B8G3B0_9RHOB|nr:nuclear transport factor 2 family protein [Paroceanicella profunda]